MQRSAAAALVLALIAASPVPAAPNGNVRRTFTWNLSAAQINADCHRQIAAARRQTDAIAAVRGPRNAASTLVALENLQADLNDNLVAETFLFFVSPKRDVRDASQACSDAVNAFQSDFGARPDIYRALLAVRRSSTATAPYQTKLLDLYLESAKRAGAALSDRQRAEFVALSKELGRLQTAFGANLGDDHTTVTVTPAQIASLDPDFAATLKRDATGNAIVRADESTVIPFLRDERDEVARQTFYTAYYRRGGAKNVALLERAIAIRARLAHLLGYRNWAEYQLANKMAHSPPRVMTFLDDLDARLLAGARTEIARLAALKAAETKAATVQIQPWDFTYYDNVLRKTAYAVDANEVKQYFPVQHTIEAVLAIYSKLLGVTFTPAADDAWLPAPSVLHYAVSDTASGRFIGDTYFDLYPRDGKYDHFANFGILPIRRLPDGRTRAPMSVIVGNWPVAAPGKPALLSHDEVQTFFHEFGHNMAAILATAPYETLSSGFRQDFVEAPSQMLENWVWDPAILKQISSRWDTGAPMPDDLVQKVIAARYVDQSYLYTRQAFYAIVDMAYHTGGSKVDTTKVWARLQDRTTPIAFIPGTVPQASFGHLMGGYDAGYYGYLWSKVYAQDLFTRFQAQGLENPAAGAAYRQDILAPAWTYEPDEEVRAFLGRPMSPVA
ncbi:MAG: Zn-dependent oligopeptidase, partial [Candidatus Eremiobacteraeota bacterium]|nr:Zn-dependent oligopeptidase [Candidatus Eremiobacteraeota bacterium]